MSLVSMVCPHCGQRYVVVSNHCPTCDRVNTPPRGGRRPAESSELQARLLGSSDASETRAATLAQYDAQLAELDRLIAVAEFSLDAESTVRVPS